MFACSMDSEASAVKIRLEEARKAANDGKQPKFDTLINEISTTLEEQFTKIATARTAASQVVGSH